MYIISAVLQMGSAVSLNICMISRNTRCISERKPRFLFTLLGESSRKVEVSTQFGLCVTKSTGKQQNYQPHYNSTDNGFCLSDLIHSHIHGDGRAASTVCSRLERLILVLSLKQPK